MALSLASIPLPVLIGVPVVGLVAAIVIYEIKKNSVAKAAAAAAALSQPVVATPPSAGATGPVSPGAVAAAAPPAPTVKLGIKKPDGTVVWL